MLIGRPGLGIAGSPKLAIFASRWINITSKFYHLYFKFLKVFYTFILKEKAKIKRFNIRSLKREMVLFKFTGHD